VFQEALKKNVDFYKLNFVKSNFGSPYLELDIPCINEIDFNKKISINLIVRFVEVLKQLDKFDENFQDDFIDLFMLYQSFFDLNSGITYKHYIGNLLIDYVKSGKFGLKAKELFDKYYDIDKNLLREISILIAENLQNEKVKSTLYKAIFCLFNTAKIYEIENRKNSFIIVCNEPKNESSILKVEIIKELFMPIEAKYIFVYDNLVPILGNNESTIINKMAIISSEELS
jgi:hypothetical protein